jgi:hypothetical protein
MNNYFGLINIAMDKGYKLSPYAESSNLVYLPDVAYIELCFIHKWLREKHFISVLPEHGRLPDESFGYFCRIFTATNKDSSQFKVFEYRATYEEALAEGIKEAIKLI